MEAAIRIRGAKEDDALALSVLAESTFRDAFANSNTAANMNAIPVSYAYAGIDRHLPATCRAHRQQWAAESKQVRNDRLDGSACRPAGATRPDAWRRSPRRTAVVFWASSDKRVQNQIRAASWPILGPQRLARPDVILRSSRRGWLCFLRWAVRYSRAGQMRGQIAAAKGLYEVSASASWVPGLS